MLDLRSNQLAGGFDLTQLPPGLRVLDLRRNQLSGDVDLTRLPATLSTLLLSGNDELLGAVDLTPLPPVSTERMTRVARAARRA